MCESAADRLLCCYPLHNPFKYSVSLLLNTLVNKAVDFMSISAEHIVLGTGEVSVYLARKQRILGDGRTRSHAIPTITQKAER
jgi:hypothetical protein